MNLPGRPAGDPNAITAASNGWQGASDDLNHVSSALMDSVARNTTGWQGSSALSLQAHAGEINAQLQQGSTHMADLATQLRSLAAKLADAQAQYDSMLIKIAEGTALGFGLSLVTAGFSDIAAAARDSLLAARIAEIVAEFAAFVGSTAPEIEATVTSIVGWSTAVGATIGKGIAVDSTVSAINSSGPSFSSDALKGLLASVIHIGPVGGLAISVGQAALDLPGRNLDSTKNVPGAPLTTATFDASRKR